jgi:hypothetical protein
VSGTSGLISARRVMPRPGPPLRAASVMPRTTPLCSNVRSCSGRPTARTRPRARSFSSTVCRRLVARSLRRPPGLNEDDWPLNGHGISALGLDLALPDIGIRCGRKEGESFVRLSSILNSHVWGGGDPLPLRRFWDLLPEMADHPLTTTRDRKVPLPGSPAIPSDIDKVVSVSLESLPAHLWRAGSTYDDLTAFLAAYPTASGYRATVNQMGIPQYRASGMGGKLSVGVSWEVGANSPSDRVRQILTSYREGLLYLFPELTPGEGIVQPLMAWWACTVSELVTPAASW